jgi:hypothetical protein
MKSIQSVRFRLNKVIFFQHLTILVFLGAAHALLATDTVPDLFSRQEPIKKWKSCKADSECIVIDTYCAPRCGDDSINSMYTSDYSKTLEKRCKSENRLGPFCTISGKAKCIQNICTFVAVKTL